MSTKFFTNQDGNSLLNKFEGVFTHVHSIQFFDALVGYFRASGYFKVRPFLDKIQKIRILVGIDVDKLTQEYNAKGQLFLSDQNKTKEQFIKEILDNIQEADYDEKTERGIIQFIEDLISGKIEVKAHPDKKLHAKIYIFRPAEFNQHSPCEVITGSSNLTDAGLGTSEESNYEFNVSLRDYDDVKFATDEFEKLWAQSHAILKAEAEELRDKSYLSGSFTPHQIYIRMLIEYFGKRVEYDPYNIDLLLPDKFKRLKYQSDAANQGYGMMMKHNGIILADVVGLGKTIIALLVAKKFIYENGTHSKILIVYPPALEISKSLFEKVNSVNRHNYSKGNPQVVKSEYLLSGLIKCSHCGFNFSGQRYYKEKIWYYQDSGYINKGKSVCSSYLIRKETIEEFIIKNIKENILVSNIEGRLQDAVESQIKMRRTGKDSSMEKLDKALAVNQTQTNNLVDAIAQGVNVDTVLDKVRSLEKERAHLIREKHKLEQFIPKKEDIKDLVKRIVSEICNFEKVFESAPTFIKKQWIRQFVLGIFVDREKNRAICQIMKIPMVSHPIMRTLIPSESSIVGVAGAHDVLRQHNFRMRLSQLVS